MRELIILATRDASLPFFDERIRWVAVPQIINNRGRTTDISKPGWELTQPQIIPLKLA